MWYAQHDVWYAQHGRRALQRASQHLNVVRHLWRLSHELKAVPPRAHAHGAERLVQLGRQLRGWQRHTVATSNA